MATALTVTEARYTVALTVNETTRRTTLVVSTGRGADGRGVPAGGTEGQVLAKASDDDFDTEWATPTGGGGGGSSITYDPVEGELQTTIEGTTYAWPARIVS